MSPSPTFIGLKGQNLIYAVTLCCSFGFLLFGYDLGFMGGLTTSTAFLDVFGKPNASLLGFLVSAYEVGAMFGAIFVFILGDRYGRKTNNIVGAIIVAVGYVSRSIFPPPLFGSVSKEVPLKTSALETCLGSKNSKPPSPQKK
jgi:MFS family permease